MRSGRVYIPDHWDGLLETLPVLTPLVAEFPQSGYLAVVFLTLMELYRGITLLPAMVQAFSAGAACMELALAFGTSARSAIVSAPGSKALCQTLPTRPPRLRRFVTSLDDS